MENPNPGALFQAAQDLDLVRRQMAALGIILSAACAVIGDEMASLGAAQKQARTAARKAPKPTTA
jgi:hypothetical protein